MPKNISDYSEDNFFDEEAQYEEDYLNNLSIKELSYNGECVCSGHSPYGPHSNKLSTKEIRIIREPELIAVIGEGIWSRVCTNHLKFYTKFNSFEIRDVKFEESTVSKRNS